ncbi:hypothetical protein CAAN1_11S01596 [[Candida] anglica]|uniref:Glycoside hydrolase family 76 protein n=1 Tax=[Candida] anglica TaxID=148631 RepID=A0ABP0EI61_9ASCO
MSLTNPNLEGYNVTRALWMRYYRPHDGTFIAPRKCSGCYNDDKFVVWAVSVAVQAVVDGSRLYKELVPLIDPAIAIFQKYKNTSLKGFSAAENGGSDKDIYYDDDAQVASAMITAYEVTGNKKYLDQGRELVRFLMGGWNDNPNAKTKGGVKWHITNAYLNACTTAEVAKACLQISKFIPSEAKVYIDFAAKCIDWQIRVLQDPEDKLIKDGIQDTADHPNDTKWSYNAGTTLSAASHLYYITKDPKWKDIATDLAKTSINRNSIIYDRDYDDNRRYWRDSSYFVQLLIEGLADYDLYVGDDAPDGLRDKIREEVSRHLTMFYEYMRDPKDGLYLQSFEPHMTYREVYDTKYKEKFQGHKGWGLKGEDKVGDEPEKCLIGCGAAARVFFQGARLVPRIE